ncbi:NUDIX hydrolase [Cryobacterium roopkundense]|uniref:8-oxo-dGTP pyrophosphatase MutT (NUDIX family) n=1 Tax=Cryobacterium roopkundense TaxID=1001240 RepID=A0A099J1G1_9MICO|nr:CoA pyrophosphatase [Cryobacterium roopkundense]KGJ72096.1 NUDIX hydrolase [Cryobacterium roopkundense]MBB5640646.1 8-oxo-dGTP pyrophosphatase MutT (NUDIX family) [Cryobacterium roopkundense]
MTAVPADPRSELAALCRRGLDWGTDITRVLPNSSTARRAAVLVLFGVLDSVPARSASLVAPDLDVLLLRRAATLGSHPGQIAFPGGRLEATDAGPVAAAVREAAEETGLDPAAIDPLGTLPDLAVPVSNHVVTPVPAGWTHPSEVAAVDHDETVEVFRVPVADLLEPANRSSTLHRVGHRTVRAPAFTVGGRLVWGFTAIVLSRMFDELGWAGSWDASRVVHPDS